ncbi:RNA polymerase sigma factor [Yoonia vestfoldensis]|uniref:RNA polymerase sigma factor n=1 Tax=Yoonia vestfoldensis TaxID=245188 RepID=UPI0003746F26|nr:sigma-70 family RNA polymerase sigma factor [Yoonia vestfoldensis]
MPSDRRNELIRLLPRLRRFACGLTGAADQADDLVQISIEKALRNLDSFAVGTRMDAWMFRIIRNTWIDMIRARRNTVAYDTEAADTIIGSDGRTTTEARLHLAEVRRAMQGLPDDQRIVLMLVCVEGMRYREVAEMLDIPEGTVMSRLSRARLALADKLKDTPLRTEKGIDR